MFTAMNAAVTKELSIIKQKRQQEGYEPENEFAAVFDDFATDDFNTRNIRVRPPSGITHGGDETRDGRQSNISRGLGDQTGDEAGDKWHQEIEYDLKRFRADIKERQNENLMALKKKKAAEEKAKTGK